MKIFVTGGAGFIGSNLCLSLLEDGHQVSIIDNCSTGTNWEEISNKVHKAYNLSIGYDILRPDMFEDIDIIYNLVGKTSHAGSMYYKFEDLASNVRAPLAVLGAVQNSQAKVIYTGSRSQYGKIQYTPVDEKHPMVPVDINGIHKIASEQYHQLFSKYYGIHTICLRLPNVFGPRHQTTTPDGVLNWFITQAICGEDIKVYGGIRDILYIDECVDALKRAAQLGQEYSGQVFNVGGRSISLESFVKIIGEIIPINYEIIEQQNKLEVGDYIADASKFYKATGWGHSSKHLKEMIEKTINFYKIEESNE